MCSGFAFAEDGLCQSLAPESLIAHEVERIHDGDTVRLRNGRSVRLMGINTPEMERERKDRVIPAQPLSAEATERLAALLGNPPQIWLRAGVEQEDRYGRLLAHGFNRQGEDVAATLLREGLGFALVVPPNLWNSDCYPEVEQQARAQQRGLWSHPHYQPLSTDQIQTGGFQRIRGVVEKVERQQKWLWIDLSDQVSLQVPVENLPHFEGVVDWLALQGHTMTAQGWLVPRKRGYRMRLRHPSAIKVE